MPSRRTTSGFEALLGEVRACTICEQHLPEGPRPILQLHPHARILIAGQAPGRRVHDSGVPFADPSGDRLRDWMGITAGDFYDPEKVAILPMGFCYPGTGASGDLPPRPECAPAWRDALLAELRNLELTLVIGQYAIRAHIPDAKRTLTETVRHWRDGDEGLFPLPHPSPRNNRWLKKNPWFAAELLPELRKATRYALRDG